MYGICIGLHADAHRLIAQAHHSAQAAAEGEQQNISAGSPPVRDHGLLEQTVIANWRASSGNVLLLPLGGGLGRVVRLGYQPMSVSVQAYTNAVHPDIQPSPSWQLKFAVSLLFPRKARK